MEKLKFKEAVIKFLDYKKNYIRKSTLYRYEATLLNIIEPHFENHESISQNDMDAFLIEKAKRGYGKKTLEGYVVALKSFSKFATKHGYFPEIKFKANYPEFAREKLDIEPLSVEEAKILAKYCEENFSFHRLAIYTTLFTGLRAGEVCALQFKDIDIDRGVLSVNNLLYRVSKSKLNLEEGEYATEVELGPPKTKNSMREIPLAKQVLFIYKHLSKIINPDYYIATGTTKPIEPNTLRKDLDAITNLLNIKRIRFHDLRHTFATRCVTAGIDIKTVSVLLGHSTIDVTLKLYTHVDDSDKLNAINKMTKKMLWE